MQKGLLDCSGGSAALESLSVAELADFSQAFSFHSLLLAIADRRRLLVELSSFPLSNDALFFDHSLEAFDRPVQGLILSNDNCGYGNHLPSANFGQ